MRRFLLNSVVFMLVLGIVVAVIYLVVNIRGANSWAACQRELAARGEKLDDAAFIPPPIPDDQNLAMAPLFRRTLRYLIDPSTRQPYVDWQGNSSVSKDFGEPPYGPPMPNIPPPRDSGWAFGQPLDLTLRQHYFAQRPDFPHSAAPASPAEDILLALTKYSPLFEELEQAAANRPLMRFPRGWRQDKLRITSERHLELLQILVRTLALRAVADINLGHNSDALRDIELMQRFCQAASSDPTLISVLVATTEARLMLQPVWEGLRARRWSTIELSRLQDILRKLDYLSTAPHAFRLERAFFLHMLESFRTQGSSVELARIAAKAAVLKAGPPFPAPDVFLLTLAPHGWYDQRKTLGALLLQQLIDHFDLPGHRILLGKVHADNETMDRMAQAIYAEWTTPLVSLNIYDGVSLKAARTQVAVDQAITACALERYYLDRQAYPVSLDELAPSYLDHVPNDVIEGGRLLYRRTPDGRYLLYSLGWNGLDDGGEIAWLKEEKPRPDDEQGDWVWQYQQLNKPAGK